MGHMVIIVEELSKTGFYIALILVGFTVFAEWLCQTYIQKYDWNIMIGVFEKQLFMT